MKVLLSFIVFLFAIGVSLANQPASKHSKSTTPYATVMQKTFVFNPRTKSWAAYLNGRKINGGVANGGKSGYRTPSGVFRVYGKQGPSYRSSRYPIHRNGTRGGAPMPYAMHFTVAGHAIHGSPQISNQNSSHGCIRVTTSAARWLNQNFITIGTKVVVYPY